MKHYRSILATVLILVVLFTSCKQKNKQQIAASHHDIELTSHSEAQAMAMYIKLMSSFNPNWEIEEPAAEDYPTYFGGAFIGDDNQLVVCIAGDTTQYRNTIAEIVESDRFRLEVCTYSYRDMMLVMDKIDEFLSNPDVPHEHPFINNFTGALADVFTNSVVIRLETLNDTIINAFKEDITDSPIVQFEEGEMPEMI